jgi:5-hydroxyisourate hydrolase
MITSHVLNLSSGSPAEGIEATLFTLQNSNWTEIGKSKTNADGRIKTWTLNEFAAGMYKIRFETEAYFQQASIITFYPYVEIVFAIESNEHYHIPLLLSPFGYSTYRGS